MCLCVERAEMRSCIGNDDDIEFFMNLANEGVDVTLARLPFTAWAGSRRLFRRSGC